LDEDLSGKLRKAGRNGVVVSHAEGASNDGRYGLLKVAHLPHRPDAPAGFAEQTL